MGDQPPGVEEAAVAFSEDDQPWAEDEPSIFDEVDESEEERELQLAEAEADAGLTISNDAVMRWLESLGTAHPLPRPEPGD